MWMQHFRFSIVFLLVAACSSPLLAQGGGGAAGAGAAYNAYQNQPFPSSQSAYANQSEFIAIRGSAELAAQPESVRLVFAITAEAESSSECAAQVNGRIKAIRTGIANIDITGERVVEDFIVILPSYIWELAKMFERDYLKERQKGFRMQTNLHVLCDDEAQALKVIQIAFKEGVTEIISFDYHHSKLDEFKKEAMLKAVKAAKDKSEILLSVLDDKPAILNIDESTKVSFPVSLYKTIMPNPAPETGLIPYNWNNYLKLPAFRPKTTFYAGSQEFADITASDQAMKPMIIIRSEVTLTYESPARKQRMKIEMEKAKKRDQ